MLPTSTLTSKKDKKLLQTISQPQQKIVSVEKLDNSTVYHKVFSFTVRVKAKALGVTEGKAELWYTSEISRTTRAGLKASIENWCEELETRFQMSPGIALERLERLKYTIVDVKQRKDPEEFMRSIIVLGKSARTANSEYAQILTAHRHLAAELRIQIPTPIANTNLTT
ncbi:hypothetical protein OnM2_105004c [Erysiphe neolycopersici]|uniref:Uncharacterized protein n=1 Tax=Erysiphe neolycopersici TaxID=212602 RepID=A0A420H7Q0_9PEZI|nr:hypothetical protein OnM2_105004c [Erysiphe neolycopersici]